MSALEQALGGPAIEVVAKATRRQFTVEYKRKIVREADGCKTPGTVGALLRREGLYSSHLTTWRAARERGELAGAPKKRGPARRVVDPRDKKLAEQARELSPAATKWSSSGGSGGSVRAAIVSIAPCSRSTRSATASSRARRCFISIRPRWSIFSRPPRLRPKEESGSS